MIRVQQEETNIIRHQTVFENIERVTIAPNPTTGSMSFSLQSGIYIDNSDSCFIDKNL